MDVIHSITLAVHLLVGFAVIGLVLIQHGKGADMGAAFGSGSSGSLFGASGSANFLSRTTAVLAALFFATSLGLSYIANLAPRGSGSVLDKVRVEQPAPAASDVKSEVPAAPAAPLDSKSREIPK